MNAKTAKRLRKEARRAHTPEAKGYVISDQGVVQATPGGLRFTTQTLKRVGKLLKQGAV